MYDQLPPLFSLYQQSVNTEWWVDHIMRHAEQEAHEPLQALIFINKLARTYNINPLNIHGVYLICCLLANKISCDITWENDVWTFFSSVRINATGEVLYYTQQSINCMELKLLTALRLSHPGGTPIPPAPQDDPTYIPNPDNLEDFFTLIFTDIAQALRDGPLHIDLNALVHHQFFTTPYPDFTILVTSVLANFLTPAIKLTPDQTDDYEPEIPLQDWVHHIVPPDTQLSRFTILVAITYIHHLINAPITPHRIATINNIYRIFFLACMYANNYFKDISTAPAVWVNKSTLMQPIPNVQTQENAPISDLFHVTYSFEADDLDPTIHPSLYATFLRDLNTPTPFVLTYPDIIRMLTYINTIEPPPTH
jgi:hypothetical protein